LEQKAVTLISLANEYGGEDNITLAIVEFFDTSEGDE
jgi:PPM family protein phosphatase